MNPSTSQIIALAKSYAEINGRAEPNGQDFLTAAVACGASPQTVRNEADIAMTTWTNEAIDVRPTAAPTLAQRAAIPGKEGKKARALLRSGKYTGKETLSATSGRWELSQ